MYAGSTIWGSWGSLLTTQLSMLALKRAYSAPLCIAHMQYVMFQYDSRQIQLEINTEATEQDSSGLIICDISRGS